MEIHKMLLKCKNYNISSGYSSILDTHFEAAQCCCNPKNAFLKDNSLRYVLKF